jgi:hypothetical protein
MSAESTSRAGTDRAIKDIAALLSTATAADTPATLSDHVVTEHVTACEIVEFLRDLAEFRTGTRRNDPGPRAAFQARKTDLVTRIAADPATATAPEGHTP